MAVMRRLRNALHFLSLVSLLALGGCAQTYSDFTERSISLEPGDLERGSLAFITPSTVTGQEEEKQAVALTFSNVLQSARPEIRIVTLAEVLSKVNTAGLDVQYKEMYVGYRDSGLFKRDLLKEIAETLETRYLAQLKLQGFKQGDKNRIQFFGVRLVETQVATLRLFLQIWDASDGTIAWEGVEELRRSRDTFTEDPVTLQDAMKHAAKEMIDNLPQAKSQGDQP
jgi:hypothetical protein